MKIFAIADLHLSLNEHTNKSMEVFGGGWENYVERLRTAWEREVSEEDLILLPGDLSWGLKLEEAQEDLRWIHERPGRKVLLKGNHDLWWSRIGYLKSLYEDMFFLQNDCCYLEQEGIAVCGSRGWVTPGAEEYSAHDEKIYVREQGRLRSSLEAAVKCGAKRIIAAMHYPPADSRTNCSAFTELLGRYPVTDCVYGHLHGHPAFGSGIRGLHDGIDYKLVSLDFLGAVPKLIWDSERNAGE